MLAGVLAAAAGQLKLPASLDVAAKACEPLFADYQPDMRRWFPIITPMHARAAIMYAGRARAAGALTADEYDFVCGACRRTIFAGSVQ